MLAGQLKGALFQLQEAEAQAAAAEEQVRSHGRIGRIVWQSAVSSP